jgi:putative transposase
MVAAAIRTIFAQRKAHHVQEQLDVISGMLGRQFPKLTALYAAWRCSPPLACAGER